LPGKYACAKRLDDIPSVMRKTVTVLERRGGLVNVEKPKSIPKYHRYTRHRVRVRKGADQATSLLSNNRSSGFENQEERGLCQVIASGARIKP